jgi:hypothetical protein
METNELIKKIEEIDRILPNDSTKWTISLGRSYFITTIQFVRNYIGHETEFYKTLNEFRTSKNRVSDYSDLYAAQEVLKSIKDYLLLNLDIQRTENYNIKVDIISDFMNQAIELASDKKFHPAAAGILMGASLEEFLKKLAEHKEIDLSAIKLTIDPISKKLYEENVITKQDLKDITSWAGIRNDASHGNFEDVNDRKRIQNAIEGVNLFMRKYNL